MYEHVLIVKFSTWMSLSAVNYSGWQGSGVGGDVKEPGDTWVYFVY